MKVLVVDDEFYTRKAIIKMLNEKLGDMLTIDEAENGAKAIEIISKQVPDLVMTDVRMPEVDGLQLAEYIYENKIKCEVIIFSGYADFEYAQRAIKYGVIDYILKPVKKEDLFKAIHNVQDKMNKIISFEADEIILKTRLQVADRAVMERGLIEVMRQKGDVTSFNYVQLLKLNKEPLWYKIFILYQNTPFEQAEHDALKKAFEKDLEGLMVTFLNQADKKEWIILCFGMDKKEQYENNGLPKQLCQIKKIFYSLHEHNIVLGASRTFPITEPLSFAYEEAKKATMVHFALGWGTLYEYEKTKELWENRKYPYYEELRIFKHLLEEGEEKAATITIKKVFLNLTQEKPLSLKLLEETEIKLTQIIMDVWNDMFNVKKDFSEYHSINQDLSDFSEIEDLENRYYKWIKEISITASQKKGIDQKTLVDELKKYMLEYYYEDISLEAFAKDKYFMHVSHLSRIFREETGDTFSNTLLKIRMEKARQLLSEKDISITQVAILSGYNNTAYFVKIFKKFYNETPGDYKKKL